MKKEINWKIDEIYGMGSYLVAQRIDGINERVGLLGKSYLENGIAVAEVLDVRSDYRNLFPIGPVEIPDEKVLYKFVLIEE